MKITSSLASRMQRLLANLHPPTVPTTKESQQLLKLLQTSLKKELDTNHPKPALRRPDHNSYNDIPISRPSTSAQAADSHFASTFAHNQVLWMLGKEPKPDTVAVFDRLIAESNVDISSLAKLTVQHLRNLKASDHDSRMRSELFGEKLNAWLLATSQPLREEFFLSLNCLVNALTILNHEHNENAMWSWLRIVYERQLVHGSLDALPWLTVEDHIVSALIGTAIQRKHLDEAAHQLIHASDYRIQSGRPNIPLTAAGQRLASAIIFYRQHHRIDVATWETLITRLPTSQNHPVYNSALCAVYDPIEPSAIGLLALLDNPLFHQRQKVSSSKARKAVMTTILDASRVCLDQGRQDKASRLLDYAIDNYPDFLPPRQEAEVEPQLELSFNLIPG